MGRPSVRRSAAGVVLAQEGGQEPPTPTATTAQLRALGTRDGTAELFYAHGARLEIVDALMNLR